jgi:hypothetical protein
MKIPPLDLTQLNRQLEAWCEQIREIEPTVGDPERRAQLRQALAQIEESQARLKADYQREVDAINARIDAAHRQVAENEAQLKALSAETGRAAPAPPTPPPIDPAHGLRLRDELLDRFAPRPVSPHADADAVDEGSVSKHWVGQDLEASNASDSVSESSDRSPEPSPPSKQRKTQSGDAWQDLSDSEK